MPNIFTKNTAVKKPDYQKGPANNPKADEWQLFRESLPDFLLRFFPLGK